MKRSALLDYMFLDTTPQDIHRQLDVRLVAGRESSRPFEHEGTAQMIAVVAIPGLCDTTRSWMKRMDRLMIVRLCCSLPQYEHLSSLLL